MYLSKMHEEQICQDMLPMMPMMVIFQWRSQELAREIHGSTGYPPQRPMKEHHLRVELIVDVEIL